jgi:hypothetical protein
VTLTNNKPAGSGLTWRQALDANNPDLSEFRRHGGKLLLYHGLADPFVSPLGSLDYYTAVVGATGGPQAVKSTQSFARLLPELLIVLVVRVPTSSMVPTTWEVRKTPTTMFSWPCGNGSRMASRPHVSSARNM